jgi:hypothetical protein
LPASTCARIPRFNERTKVHVLCVGGSRLVGHERRSHENSPSVRTYPHTEAGAGRDRQPNIRRPRREERRLAWHAGPAAPSSAS